METNEKKARKIAIEKIKAKMQLGTLKCNLGSCNYHSSNEVCDVDRALEDAYKAEFIKLGIEQTITTKNDALNLKPMQLRDLVFLLQGLKEDDFERIFDHGAHLYRKYQYEKSGDILNLILELDLSNLQNLINAINEHFEE